MDFTVVLLVIIVLFAMLYGLNLFAHYLKTQHPLERIGVPEKWRHPDRYIAIFGAILLFAFLWSPTGFGVHANTIILVFAAQIIGTIIRVNLKSRNARKEAE